MKQIPRRTALAATVCATGMALMAGQSALAEVTYKFSGFGTLGGVVTNTDDTEFRTSVEQYRGANKDVDLGVDSRLAGQGTVSFGHGFGITGQVLGTRRGDDDFDATFEWIYAQYTGVDGLDLRAGRVVLPSFLVSDSRMVGYASPWLRVSPLVYSMMPLSNVDGGQVTYRHAIGPAIVSAQLTSGTASTTSRTTSHLFGPFYAPGTAESKASAILGLNATVEWGDWTFRASQVKDDNVLDITISLPAALGGGTTAQQLKFEDKFQEVGLQYDNGTVVVMSEFVKRTTENAKVQDAKSWYVAAGYRFGTVMPYAMVSQYKEDFSLSGTPPPKTTGLALGGRYDFATNLALKAEWARYKNYSTYVFTDAVSPAAAGKKVNVFSVALDFVF